MFRVHAMTFSDYGYSDFFAHFAVYYLKRTVNFNERRQPQSRSRRRGRPNREIVVWGNAAMRQRTRGAEAVSRLMPYIRESASASCA